jgi:hypothetical protein
MGFFRSRKIALVSLSAALASFTTFTFAAQTTITLAWDPVSSLVPGYRLYQGVVSKTYTNIIDVGNSTSATISGLDPYVTYFFAVSAYDALGLESPLSAEITFGPPVMAPPQLQVVGAQGGQVLLQGTGQAGRTYDLLGAAGVTGWKVIGTVTVGASGSFQFVDPTTSSALADLRSYRLQEVTLPEPLPILNIKTTASGQVRLSGTGLLGHTYDILTSDNLAVWQAVGSVTAGSGGLLNFVVPLTRRVGPHFYRLHETTYLMPGTLPKLSIHITPTKQVRLDLAGQVGHTYTVSATQDRVSWTSIGSGIVGASGSLQFSDPIGATAPARFYRSAEVLP